MAHTQGVKILRHLDSASNVKWNAFILGFCVVDLVAAAFVLFISYSFSAFYWLRIMAF